MSKLTRTKKQKITEAQREAAGVPVAILHTISNLDGTKHQYWVSGYERWQEHQIHSVRNGAVPLTPRQPKKKDHCWVLLPGQAGALTQYHNSRVKEIEPGKHYFSFEELYGKSLGGDSIVDAVIESEEEDLSIGLNEPVEQMEE